MTRPRSAAQERTTGGAYAGFPAPPSQGRTTVNSVASLTAPEMTQSRMERVVCETSRWEGVTDLIQAVCEARSWTCRGQQCVNGAALVHKHGKSSRQRDERRITGKRACQRC